MSFLVSCPNCGPRDVNEFVTLHDAREKLKAWQHDYNQHRPHGSLGT